MDDKYLEKINKATYEYPFITCHSSNFNYMAHYHEEIEVIYVICGQTVLTVDGAENLLKKGDIFIVMPGEIHSFAGKFDSRLYIIKLFTPKELYYIRINGRILPCDAAYNFFKTILESIVAENFYKSLGYMYVVNAQTNLFISGILRLIEHNKQPESIRKSTTDQLVFLNNVNLYLENHYSEKVTLDTISKHVGYSKYYFAHIFKKVTHQSFVSYITLFRLKKAKEMLEADASVTQTSLECGFNNLVSLTRYFKKIYNMTPLEFKKNNRKAHKSSKD